MHKLLFMFALLLSFCIPTHAKTDDAPKYSANERHFDDSISHEEVMANLEKILNSCKNNKTNNENGLSDYEIVTITNEENACLKAELLKIVDKNFSYRKQQEAKKELIQAIDTLEHSYTTYYWTVANMSDYCIDSEDSVISCGTAARMIAPSLWQKQLTDMITFLYTYGHEF